jgi:hypothetical protein
MNYAKLYRCNPLGFLIAILLILLQAGCGGGSSSSASNTPIGTTPTVPSTSAKSLSNFQNITASAGPANSVNLLFTNITICAPGSTTDCHTVDNILVDTGSVGLRLFASTLPAGLKLVQQKAANGTALVECTQFADGYIWGPVKAADVKLGGEVVPSMSIQIAGDPAFTNVPSDCSSSGPSENTVNAFGANGVLGIGNFISDCGNLCASTAVSGAYYACSSSTCSVTNIASNQQIQNPVALLSKNNNGVLLQLPGVPLEGAANVGGLMIFGIGTEANNQLGAVKVYTVDPSNATFSITLNGTSYPGSFIDSGSNAFFFPSKTIPVCASGFYCANSPQTLDVFLQGKNGINTSFGFTIANADAQFQAHPNFNVFPLLGGPGFDNNIDLGLPFFFGRTVYTAIEERQTPGGPGPYVAF